MYHFQKIFLPFSHLSQFKRSVLIATHETKLLIELLQMLCLIILISHKKGWWCKLFSWKYFLWCFEMGWLFESSGINFTEERQQENQGCIWSIIIWCLLLQWQCTLPGQDTKHWKTWGGIMMTSLHHKWANGGENNKHLISIGFLSWHFLPHWIRSATNQKMIPCLLVTKKLLILLTWTQYKIHWYLSTLDLCFPSLSGKNSMNM